MIDQQPTSGFPFCECKDVKVFIPIRRFSDDIATRHSSTTFYLVFSRASLRWVKNSWVKNYAVKNLAILNSFPNSQELVEIQVRVVADNHRHHLMCVDGKKREGGKCQRKTLNFPFENILEFKMCARRPRTHAKIISKKYFFLKNSLAPLSTHIWWQFYEVNSLSSLIFNFNTSEKEYTTSRKSLGAEENHLRGKEFHFPGCCCLLRVLCYSTLLRRTIFQLFASREFHVCECWELCRPRLRLTRVFRVSNFSLYSITMSTRHRRSQLSAL